MESKNTPIIGIVIAAAIALLGIAAFFMSSADSRVMQDDAMKSDDATQTSDKGMMKDDAMTNPQEGALMDAGSYQAYSADKLALADTGTVVLFFHASWCPTCRALDADIKAHLSEIPAHVTILDVDYDTSTALKQKYGVTSQHTLVQVDSAGNLITKWSGSPSLAELTTHIK